MTYNLEWLIPKYENGEALEYVFFWGHRQSSDGALTPSCFSQWRDSSFTVDSVVYRTAEHWMMAQKALLFDDKKAFRKVVSANTPAEVKALGRKVRNFDEEIWTSKREEIVVQGNLHKFSQNKSLLQFLLATKNKILAEASPLDRIWGIGLSANDEMAKNPKRWKGLNLLGFTLMEVRDLLSD